MSEKVSFPFTIRNLTPEENELLDDFYQQTKIERVKFIENRTCLPSTIRELKDVFYNFKPRPDDVWVFGFPRSGTTLIQEVLYLLENDMNFEKAASEIMDIRFPMLHMGLHKAREASSFEKYDFKDKITMIPHEFLEKTDQKRFIKSHLGFSFIHPDLFKIGCKVVFIARNPKDVLNSYAYFPHNAMNANFTFEKMWKIFKSDLTFGGNYYDMLEDAWLKRHEKNLLILFYEEVNADKKSAILKIAEFLGKNINGDELEKLVNHLRIDSFKKNKSLNNDHLIEAGVYVRDEEFSFIRKGVDGGWRDRIPPGLIGEIDDWIKENLGKIPDFEIPKCWEKIMDLK